MKIRALVLTIFLLIAGTLKIKAQTCTGSLGDPIINIDFGAGTTKFGPPLGSTITNYAYIAGTPEDGQYTITNSSANTNPGWWTTPDNTHNPGGYFMLVNCNYTPGIFYTQPLPPLCPGTTYEFAAYIMNLLNRPGLEPNITFTIETPTGQLLATPYVTGDIPGRPGPEWKKWGFTFTTPAIPVDAVLKMTNNGPGGPGNDIAIDDITFRPCGPVITSSFSSTNTVTQLNACSGDNLQYNLKADVSTGLNNPAYQWQVSTGSGWTDINGATSKTYTVKFQPAVAGTYQYRMTSAEAVNITSNTCRYVSNILTLTINTTPPSTGSSNSPVCEGDVLNLTASAGATYSWTGPNGFTSTQQNPVINNATAAATGDYQVTVVSASQCTTSASVRVVVNPRPTATVSADVSICEGSSTTLQASGGVKYSWLPTTGLSDPTIANPVASPTDTTKYTVTVTNSSNCTATASVNVNVFKKPIANAGADRKMTEGQSIKLNGKAKGTNVSYYWTPTNFLSDPTILNPVASPTADITYTLHVVSGGGCKPDGTDDVFIRVYKKVTIPNTFTPNGDGKNDTWAIEALETYPESTTQVFNRYGSLVFQSQGYARAWDGKKDGQYLPGGTYYYIIDLKNGTKFSGWVMLLR